MLRILDLSSNNGPVDLARVAAAGVAGIIAKSTEGTGFADPTYPSHWADAHTLGLWRGAYCFSRPEASAGPEAQADFFLSHLQTLGPGDALALDIETPLDESRTDYSDWALAWLERVTAQAGFKPLVYSFSDFILRHLTSPRLADYDLWLASWGTWLPPSIGPWSSVALWQDSDSSTCPGISGPVDESVIARDLAGLRALGKPSPVPVPPLPLPYPTGPVYRVTMPHFGRILPRAAAPHAEATLINEGELLDANAHAPEGLPSWTTSWRWVRRRKTGVLEYAYAPNLALP